MKTIDEGQTTTMETYVLFFVQDVWFHPLFNLYAREAIHKIREEIEVGIRTNGVNDNEGDLQKILELVNSTMKNEYNMKIIRAKT